MSKIHNKSVNIKHVAIIMDGNRRWAKKHAFSTLLGHQKGADAVREVVEGAIKHKLEYLSLYVFSSENWNRDKKEVAGLQNLLVKYLNQELPYLIKNDIKLLVIGDYSRFNPEVIKKIEAALVQTSNNKTLNLVLALNYGSRSEIVYAVNKIINNRIDIEEITEDNITNNLYTSFMPDPDFIIRTSGEFRVSNFMLWQLAYSELIFLDLLWPDFKIKDFDKAVEEFQQRERRYGGN